MRLLETRALRYYALSTCLAVAFSAPGCKTPMNPSDIETPESALNSMNADAFIRALESNNCDQYFGRGYCTDYVRQNASAAPPPSGKSGGPLAWWDNPGTLSKESVPAEGAIAILDIFRGYGHTGIVREVLDHSFIIEEWNYGPELVDAECGVTNKFGALVNGATTMTPWAIDNPRVVGFLYPPGVTAPVAETPTSPPGGTTPAPQPPGPGPTPSPDPMISSVSPTSRPNSDANFRMTITGANFDGGAVDQVYRNDTFIGQGEIVSQSESEIVVDQQMTGIGVGTYTLFVKNSDGKLSNGVPFEVTEDVIVPPRISSISPRERPNSDANFRMTIRGENFDDGAVDQVYRGSTFIGQGDIVSRTDSRIVVDQQMTGIGVGTYTIRVQNSDGTTSNGRSFEITADAILPPTISSISPTSRPNTNANFQMTINGNNFDGGAVDEVYRGGVFIGQGDIVSRTGTKIVVDQQMTGIGVGTYTIYVRNSDGSRSNGVSFEITP